LKIPGKHKSFVELPIRYIEKLGQNRKYLGKKAPLLPSPCSHAVLAQNETALLERGEGTH
jgi:hypothetical protein